MDYLKTFSETMEKTAHIALATSRDANPNVRIMTIWYDPRNKGVIYFPSAKNSPKTVEFAHNNKVAFTTVANFEMGVIRVKDATVHKSELAVDDIKDGIARNDTLFANTLERMGLVFEVYELHFDKAYLTVGAGQNVEVTL